MDLFLLFSLISIFIFGLATIYLSIKEEEARKQLKEQDETQKQKIYQISILKEIQDRIGYSLDVEKVIDVITGTLRNLFSYSTASSMIVRDNTLIFKTYLEEAVSHSFVSSVRKSMQASLSALLDNLPSNIDERISGVAFDDANSKILASFFHIPLVINNKVVGLINVSSTQPNLYKETQMTILYEITGQASNALSRLEEVLESEKGKLLSLIRSLADGVFMTDTKNNIIIMNDAAKSLLGISKDNPTFFDIIANLPERFDLVAKINDAINQNKTIEEKEVNIGEKTLQIFITPVPSTSNDNQKVARASILLHDITIEKNLANLKEDFTNIMVHELRAPLTAIKDSSELIISEKDKLKKEEQDQFLDIINQQSKLMLNQIGEILDAAKLEAGKFIIQKTKGNIEQVIKEQIKTFLPQASKKHIFISADISQSLPPIFFDPIRIAQVINNLLSNSLKFTPEGGTITIRISHEPITNNQLTISVSDTGIGIPKEHQKDLFSKFSQVRTTPQQLAKEGTGLGLYVVKGVVEAHGGSVNVDSPLRNGEKNPGTTISFTLPINTQEDMIGISPRTIN